MQGVVEVASSVEKLLSADKCGNSVVNLEYGFRAKAKIRWMPLLRPVSYDYWPTSQNAKCVPHHAYWWIDRGCIGSSGHASSIYRNYSFLARLIPIKPSH